MNLLLAAVDVSPVVSGLQAAASAILSKVNVVYAAGLGIGGMFFGGILLWSFFKKLADENLEKEEALIRKYASKDDFAHHIGYSSWEDAKEDGYESEDYYYWKKFGVWSDIDLELRKDSAADDEDDDDGSNDPDNYDDSFDKAYHWGAVDKDDPEYGEDK